MSDARWTRFALLALALLAGSDVARAQTCASPIEAALGDTPFSTTAGSFVNLTGLCDISQLGPDVIYNRTWLRFTAPASGTYTAQTCGLVNFDTKIAVFADCNFPSSVIACNDDSPGCLLTGGAPWASQVTWDAVAGQTYSIAVGGFSPATNGSGAVRILLSGSPRDGSTCAQALDAADGLTNFSTLASTEDLDLAGSCNPGAAGDDTLHRVQWFRYVATQSGNVEVTTCGLAAFDTRLAVLMGCSPVDAIACNDDGPGCTGFTSTVRFVAAVGVEYLVAVGGFDDANAGAGQFRITPGVPDPPSCGTAQHSCCTVSDLPFCSDGACCALVCAEDPFCCSADGSWDETCALRAGLYCGGCGAGACDVPTDGTAEAEPCGADVNGGCASFKGITEPIAPGIAVQGSFWADADARDTDWYSFSVGANSTVVAELRSKAPGVLFLVDSSCPPAVIAQSGEFSASCPARIEACVLPGEYRLIASMSVFSGFPCGDAAGRNAYRLQLDVSGCDAVPPSNDECATAADIPGSGGSLPFDTRLSTNSAGSLPASCDEGSGPTIVRDVWYRWTPAPGVARVSTCGSAGFDTRLVAYAACGGAPVACNDDSLGCSGFTSRMYLPSDGATTYLIRLGGFDSVGTGDIAFDVLQPLLNDECAGATTIGSTAVPFSTELATKSVPALPALCDEGFGLDIGADIWFRWTAPRAGVATVSTCGAAQYDTWLAAYDACGGSIIACNDDSTFCTGLTSRMQMNVETGATYLIRVGGHDESGTGTLTVTVGDNGPGGPANDTCTSPQPAFDGLNPFDNSLSQSDPPTAPSGGCPGTGIYNDVWFIYTPGFGGLTDISLCDNAPFDTRLEVWTGCPDAGGTVVACNDDSCAGRSRIVANLQCGQSYLIRLGSFGPGGFGQGRLAITGGILSCNDSCRADLDNNGAVGGTDLSIILLRWGTPGPGDLDGDGIVSGGDLTVLLAGWGPCPPP